MALSAFVLLLVFLALLLGSRRLVSRVPFASTDTVSPIARPAPGVGDRKNDQLASPFEYHKPVRKSPQQCSPDLWYVWVSQRWRGAVSDFGECAINFDDELTAEPFTGLLIPFLGFRELPLDGGVVADRLQSARVLSSRSRVVGQSSSATFPC